MKLLFENWRKYLNEEEVMFSEELLLLEEGVLTEGALSWAAEKFKSLWNKMKADSKAALEALTLEWEETKEIKPLLDKIYKDGKLTKEEWQKIGKRTMEYLKVAGWGGFAAVPGTMPLVIIMVKALEKFGRRPLPDSWYKVRQQKDGLSLLEPEKAV